MSDRDARADPSIQAPSDPAPPEFVRLARSISDPAGRLIAITGAAPGVGTTYVTRGLARAGSDIGIPTEILALDSLPDAGRRAGRLCLLDTAPIATSAQTHALMAQTDGVVLVVEAERTTRRQIDRALDAIAGNGGTCLGLALNHRPGGRASR